MLTHLQIPESLQRNTPAVREAGYENTGLALINLATRKMGFDSLAGLSILDVGCGVRFTQTLINQKVDFGSYTGIEIEKSIVDFLNREVAANDDRFVFAHLEAANVKYAGKGKPMASFERLPIDSRHDIIWLFSVFTHLDPQDSAAMLKFLRRHIKPGGKLFFSAFIDEKLEGFDDRVKDKPLLKAYYGPALVRSMIGEAGWRVESFYEPEKFIQHHFVCSPV
ncbi:MAG TPA: methyltransferase [Tepidisphaeraceae bacterium]|jgi:SAM-dependent methyltransferase|nr:methyltransferase [Tepidisphaeraceae bacterium]